MLRAQTYVDCYHTLFSVLCLSIQHDYSPRSHHYRCRTLQVPYPVKDQRAALIWRMRFRCSCPNWATTEDFIRTVYVQLKRSPVIILSLYVTVMVYRNCKAVRKCSQEPPIFIGPIMLHSDGRLALYIHFFSAISAALNCTALASSELVCDGLVVGSGEELAMVSAPKSAFPRANH